MYFTPYGPACDSSDFVAVDVWRAVVVVDVVTEGKLVATLVDEAREELERVAPRVAVASPEAELQVRDDAMTILEPVADVVARPDERSCVDEELSPGVLGGRAISRR